MRYFIAALVLLASAVFVFGSDEIKRLPGLKFKLNFKQYSGYLQVSDTHFLHYWFVESQNDPSSDPLIFWFNGGPGCSSLEGLIHEMGPFQINPDGKTLRKNPNAWNQFASVVYIEAPAGVGYSYASDGNTTTNDELTAQENYEAIKQFFLRYPTFRNQSTFIMGESYGGMYVPMLTAKIIENQNEFNINLSGMAIGNGLISHLHYLETKTIFAYSHGFIDEADWTTFEQTCCSGCVDTCNFTNLTGDCYNFVAYDDLFHVNPYDIYATCNSNEKATLQEVILNQNLLMVPRFAKKSLNATQKLAVPCFNDTDIITYLNLPSVRKALHIPENLPKWDVCDFEIHQTYQMQYDDTTTFFRKALDANVSILLYYGDTDIICNFLMGQKFAALLDLPVLEKANGWKVNGQIGGFKTVYQGLTFTTIRGAGHMAPQLRPAETAHAIKQFVSNQPL